MFSFLCSLLLFLFIQGSPSILILILLHLRSIFICLLQIILPISRMFAILSLFVLWVRSESCRGCLVFRVVSIFLRASAPMIMLFRESTDLTADECIFFDRKEIWWEQLYMTIFIVKQISLSPWTYFHQLPRWQRS